MTIDFREYEPGMLITEPGAYLNVPMSVYHGQPCAGPSVSSSGLRTIFGGSLKHFWDESSFNPNRKEFTDTEFTILGRAAHHLILQEPDFDKYFVLRPEVIDGEKWQGNKTICKKWMAEQALAGLTVVTMAQMEQIRGIAESLAAEPIVRGGILNGYIEVSLFWQDAETGIWLKSRPDSVPNASGDASDLKCVSDVSDDGISRALADRGYHAQGALIGEAFREVLGMEMEHFSLVYVEGKRPHSVRIDEPHPEEIAQGYEENHAALRLLKRALDTGYWPGPKNPSGDGGYIRRPKWSREQSERRLKLIAQELAA
ncbi:MAG: PD-(D/E)XK nuclease-like domain-containing protein [Devosia sp.]|nr:PD-(D/E)XK nuclease-like domain-containing protein [Devosia sp.]